ncbi:MAG TPA: protein kinase [Thermoanaerobaculia bacterium]
MTLSSGSRLGPYEIVSPLGAGGMGEVYRARDVRLGRDVALKVLPEELSREKDRLARFEQEARSASALNHPNIVTIHDIGQIDGTPYIAMELVEGKTLRELSSPEPLPLRKLLAIGPQIAEGLAKAHAAGIVHRDLKPENLMVSKDGFVKILDFGLAKLSVPESGGVSAMHTLVRPETHPGTVMGTVSYMSPEQASGQNVDYRSDQFSLGSILYEAVSGQKAFDRKTAAETMSAIIREDPKPISQAAPQAPLPLRWIVDRCLAKDPEERYASTKDLARDLAKLRDHVSEISGEALAAAPGRSRKRGLLPLVAGGMLLAALGALLGTRLLRPRPAAVPELRFLTFSGDDWGPSASPDGKFVAFLSERGGTPRVWLKELAGGSEVPVTSGPDHDAVQFSSDGSTLFIRREEEGTVSLYRVPVVGGEARRIRRDVRGAAVSPDGRLVAYTDVQGAGRSRQPGVWIAPLDGTAAPRELLRLDGGTIASLAWSPDGGRIAAIHQDAGTFTVPPRLLVAAVAGAQRLDIDPSGPAGLLGAVEWDSSGGSLLYTRLETIATSDLTGVGRLYRCDLRSGAHAMLLSFPRAIGIDSIALLGPGRIVLDADDSRENLREVGISSGGGDRLLTHGNSTDRQPVYSRDGEWIAFTSSRGGNWDLWRVSRKSGEVRRLTDQRGHDWDPAYTPDGGSLLWSSDRTGNFEIWIAEADGSSPRQVTRDGVDAQNPTATPDGWIVYDSRNPKHPGVWIARPDGSQARRIFEGATIHPEVSPDGRHALFFELVPGLPGLRVVGLPDGAPVDFEIPKVEGNRARWMPDGKRIAFHHRDEQDRSGLYVQDFVPGRDTSPSRRKLAGFDPVLDTESFGISPDGQRVTLAQIEWGASLLLVEGLAGIGERRAAP